MLSKSAIQFEASGAAVILKALQRMYRPTVYAIVSYWAILIPASGGSPDGAQLVEFEGMIKQL